MSPQRSAFGIWRFNADGSPDKTFGISGNDGGNFTLFSEVFAEIRDIAFAENDDIVAVGTVGENSIFYQSAKIALVRYTKDGHQYSDFGDGGRVVSNLFGSYEQGNAVVVQSDGHILVAGSKDFSPYSGPEGDFLLARYNKDGSLDTTFGDEGKVSADFGSQDIAFTLALQSDGGVLVGGQRRTQYLESRQSDFALARYELARPVPTHDFFLTTNQTEIESPRKGMVHLPISINRVGALTGNVTLTAPDVKSMKINVTPSSITTTGTEVSFKLKLKKAVRGTHQLIFKGRDETGLERLITFTLTIR